MVKKRKSECDKEDPIDCENTYGIYHLKIGEVSRDLYDSEWLLVQRRIRQMENKIHNDKVLTHEFNVLSNILNPMKREKSKNSRYSLILQGCRNTRSGRAKIRNFPILLDSWSSSKIVMGKMASNLKEKSTEMTT